MLFMVLVLTTQQTKAHSRAGMIAFIVSMSVAFAIYTTVVGMPIFGVTLVSVPTTTLCVQFPLTQRLSNDTVVNWEKFSKYKGSIRTEIAIESNDLSQDFAIEPKICYAPSPLTPD